MKRIVFFILTLLLFEPGCKNGKQKTEILSIDSMKVVMFDFLIADEWNSIRMVADSNFVKSKSNLKTYQQVLAIHHTTKAQFDSSLNYYERNPKIFKTLIDSVNAYGSRLKNNSASKAEKALKKPNN